MMKKYRWIPLILLILFLSSFAFSDDPWLADGSTRRQKITIQGTNLDANQTWFPVFVYIDPAAQGATMTEAAADGTDIRFTESDGTTLLDYERMSWSGGGGGAVTAYFWVSNDGWTINADGSTYIYVYYGSGGADGENATGVWDAGFMGVWHLDETSGGPYTDSTSNAHNSTGGTMPDQVNGKFHKAQDFESASSEFINFGDVCDLGTNDFTISAWINPDDATSNVIVGSRVAGTGIKISQSSSDAYALVEDSDSDEIFADTAGDICPASSWVYFVTIGDKSEADGLRIYINNVRNTGREGDLTGIGNIDGSESLGIGSRAGTNPGTYFNGLIQEVRISNTLRSTTWIKFEYYNMNEADQELTWGIEQSSSPSSYIPRVIIIK